MFNTKSSIAFTAACLLLIFLACCNHSVVNGYWQQRKVDEFRTNSIGFLPNHDEWSISIQNMYALKDFSSLVVDAKQSVAFAIISNSTSSSCQLLQIDLMKGYSKLVELSAHVKGIIPVSAVMNEDGKYYVLAKNYLTLNTLLVQINILTSQVATLSLESYGTPFEMVYSKSTCDCFL